MSVQFGDEAARVRAHLGDRIADLERDLAEARAETEIVTNQYRNSYESVGVLLKENQGLKHRAERAERERDLLRMEHEDICQENKDLLDASRHMSQMNLMRAELEVARNYLAEARGERDRLRERLESAEEALKNCIKISEPYCNPNDMEYCGACVTVRDVARAALGAAGEETQG